jgi:ABC-type uncharacterized transport system ATPase subunit
MSCTVATDGIVRQRVMQFCRETENHVTLFCIILYHTHYSEEVRYMLISQLIYLFIAHMIYDCKFYLLHLMYHFAYS